MPPRDLYHDAVKEILVKDGWTITDDFCQAAIEAVIADHRIKLLVFDPDKMEVVQWID